MAIVIESAPPSPQSKVKGIARALSQNGISTLPFVGINAD